MKPPHYLLDKDVTYKKFTYHPWARNKFNKIFKHHNVVLMSQKKYTIKHFLNSNLKDSIPPEKKSGLSAQFSSDWERRPCPSKYFDTVSVFSCACPTVITSISSKSFHFPFPYFVKICIGKTKRDLEIRVKEHFRNNGEIEKSAVAAHVWKEKHAIGHIQVLLKQASNKQELTNCENNLITKKKDRIINV